MIYMFELDCVHVCIDVWFLNQDLLQVSNELISIYVELCDSHVKPLNLQVEYCSHDYILVISMCIGYV